MYIFRLTFIETLRNTHPRSINTDDMTHTAIGNQFARLYYSYRKDDINDFQLLSKQSDKLLKSVMAMEHKLLYQDSFFTEESRVWDTLRADYRAYRDTGNINKSIQNVFKKLNEIKQAIDNQADNQTLAGIYRETASHILNIKLQIRREIVRNMVMNEKLGLEESIRPEAKMIGEDGNVFNLMGICSNALKKAGYPDKSKEMFDRVTSCGSYDEALAIMNEYVIPTGDEQTLEDTFDMEMNGF